ncbi:MAG: UDP-2,3-diacylglucosamine diphosphatase LpxI [Verrucomicrobiota bacterium]|nr:UDP-2,3-diacylglucosamine diphosphatase LpxI [Verrucomicrobiota bacterium]
MSRFLPDDFDSSKSLALIAGKGIYPQLLAERARKAGISLRLIELGGETSPELIESFGESERAAVKVGQVGKLLKELKRLGAGYVVMAGQVTPGKLFRGLHPDLKAIRMLAGLERKNAETIFGAIGEEIEKSGVQLLDARILMDEDLAEEGMFVKGKEKIEPEHIKHGIEIARENARLDVGQGVVVSQGTVLAVEAFEGTNAMLQRAGEFRAKNCLFVKVSKPQQDTRFDVPVFGLHTLQEMKKAGIGNVALESGSVLLLDKPQVLAKAKALGIGLTSIPN